MIGKADTSMAAQDTLSREAFEMPNHEMKTGQLRVDNLQAELVHAKTSLERAEDLEVLFGKVKSAAASLHYLRSKARILADLGLTLSPEQLEDDSSVPEVVNPGEDTLTGTDKNHHPLVVDDAWKTLQCIQMVSDVVESLFKRVTLAESEASFQKERVIIGEEEIRRKTVQVENLSLRLEEMKCIVHRNKTTLDETAEIIKKLVEDSMIDREKAEENEEELHRVKAECESLRSCINNSSSVIETLLESKRQFHIIEDRLVAKSTQLESEKAQKEVELQKLMEENEKLATLLDKKEAQLMALNEHCKVMALNASDI